MIEPQLPSQQNRNPAIAAFLSALLPGLGQMYNGQWAKGAGFLFSALVLIGGLLSSTDFNHLEEALASGQPPTNLGQVFLLVFLQLIIALWSVMDAVRGARRT